MSAMKDVRVTFTNGEHERLNTVKGENRTWREAILDEFGVDSDE